MAFDYCTLPADDENRSGRLSLLQWGVAVSPYPRENSPSEGSSRCPGAVSFLRPCQDSRPAALAAHVLTERGLSSAGMRWTHAYRQPSAFSWQSDIRSTHVQKPFYTLPPRFMHPTSVRPASFLFFLSLILLANRNLMYSHSQAGLKPLSFS